MNDKALSLLGLARRAGKLVLGYDAAVDSAKSGRGKLMLTASDISPKTLKELKYALRDESIELSSLDFSQKELEKAIGRSVKIICVEDDGFAQALKKLLSSCTGEESQYGDKK